MFVFSKQQFSLLESASRERFAERLAAHLRRGAPAHRGVDARELANQALRFADAHGLQFEDEIAAIADVMLAVHVAEVQAEDLEWLREIVEDGQPGKARRLRQCLAIARRVAPLR